LKNNKHEFTNAYKKGNEKEKRVDKYTKKTEFTAERDVFSLLSFSESDRESTKAMNSRTSLLP